VVALAAGCAAGQPAGRLAAPLSLLPVPPPFPRCCTQVAVALLGKQLSEVQVDPYVMQRLRADVEMQLGAFKNAAYATGFTSAQQAVVAATTKRWL